MLAWHFLNTNKKLGYGDNRLVEVGKTYAVECEPIICEIGLHASIRAIDALRYAPGPTICRVEIGGIIIKGDDKIVGTSRQVIAMIDATDILHELACICAETALLISEVTDMRCWNAIEAKRAWLRKEISDQELTAAWNAARTAAGAAARDAAGDAAGAAAWNAARTAAWTATWAAARAATWTAAGAAAWNAARAAAWAAARDAAGAAAWNAARTAARAAARDAARDAAGAATWAAAWNAARAAARTAAGAAAWTATWAAARAAAGDETNAVLESMLLEAMNIQ